MISDPMCPNIRVSLYAKEATVSTSVHCSQFRPKLRLVILKFLILHRYCEPLFAVCRERDDPTMVVCMCPSTSENNIDKDL